MSWLRHQSPWTAHLASHPPATPQGVILTAEAEQGRILFQQYGCTSCHSVGGSGHAKVGTDLARMGHIYSQAELRQYILHPPRDVAMPGYADRIPADHLERVVAFVLVAQTFRRTQE